MDSIISKPLNGLVRTLSLIACAVCLAALVGCGSQAAQPAQEEGKAPADYMNQMAQKSSELSIELGQFAEAVAAGDVASMQAKADIAYESISKMKEIEAPDSIKEVADKYNEAIDDLQKAMGDYVSLYVELDGATAETPFDYASFPKKLESIQQLYDEGLNLLEEADKTATEL